MSFFKKAYIYEIQKSFTLIQLPLQSKDSGLNGKTQRWFIREEFHAKEFIDSKALNEISWLLKHKLVTIDQEVFKNFSDYFTKVNQREIKDILKNKIMLNTTS